MGTVGFLDLPVVTPEAHAIFAEDIADEGYVMNVSRLWAYNPGFRNPPQFLEVVKL
jgi:hypothetical protein